MNLRTVSIKDYQKIKKLFIRNNLEIVSFERWKSLWQKNPILKNKKKWVKGWIIEENKKVVGHFGSFPAKYFLKNKSYLCSVLYGWVVDKNFRSQSILLLKKFFMQSNIDFFLGTTTNVKAGKIMEAFKAKPIPVESLTYSSFIILNFKKTLKYFLNKKTLPFKKILYNLIARPLFYILKIKINSWENKFSDDNIVKCKKIDSRFNNIWKNIKHSNKSTLLFHRDKNWLKWHLDYLLRKNKVWIFLSVENKKINGYAICIENTEYKNSLKRAFLIDLISLDKDGKISTNLIGSCIKEAKKRNCDIFEFRGFDSLKRSYIKFFNPFEKKLSHNQFYYKSNNNDLGKMLSKSSYWSPSYMDGDVIINF